MENELKVSPLPVIRKRKSASQIPLSGGRTLSPEGPGSAVMMNNSSGSPSSLMLKPDIDDKVIFSRRHSANVGMLQIQRTSLEFIPETLTTEELLNQILDQLPTETREKVKISIASPSSEEEEEKDSAASPSSPKASDNAGALNDAKLFKIMQKLREEVLLGMQPQEIGSVLPPFNPSLLKKIDTIVQRAMRSTSPTVLPATMLISRKEDATMAGNQQAME